MLSLARAPWLLVALVCAPACSTPESAPVAPASPSAPASAPLPAAAAPTPTAPEARIRISAPLANARVDSPLAIRGEARGSWFFEATFPVVLLDANGKELAKHYATAEGEWMTDAFVPFMATLEFAKPTTPSGTLVLERANASGLPEHAAEVKVAVRFAE
jgi:hypothetical protein